MAVARELFENPWNLFAQLRDAGLRIGIGEELKLLRLLDLLAKRGVAIDSAEAFTNWLSPVLCTRSDQTSRLKEALTPYFPAVPTQPRGPSSPIRETWGGQVFLLIALGLVLLTLLALLIYGLRPAISYLFSGLDLDFSNYFVPLSKSGSADLVGSLRLGPGLRSGMIVVPVLMALGAILYRRRRLALRESQIVGEGKIVPIPLTPPADDSNNPQLLRASRVLNRPTEIPTRRLDVQSTIRATAAAAGRFLPIAKVQRVQANWLLLVERAGPEDPLPAFGARLSKLFDRSRVRHSLYEFMRSPTWIRQGGPRGRLLSMERAIALDRPTRVLILAEAGRLIEPGEGRPARWLSESDLPSPIVLLTPKPREGWGVAEAQAAQAGILVLPANADGLSSLARRIQADNLQPDQFTPNDEEELDRLQADRFTWLSEVEPASQVRNGLGANLRRILNERDFRLLVGTAAFPEVRLDLMSTLDATLHPAESPANQRARLLRLGRLVWLKESFLPDWLRSDLLMALPRAELRTIREAWIKILGRKAVGSSQDALLHVHLSDAGTEENAQGDGLFLDFVRGKFDLPVPVNWAGLAGWWRPPDRTEVMIASAGAAAALFIPILQGDIASAFNFLLRTWSKFTGELRSLVPLASIPPGYLMLGALIPLVMSIGDFVLRSANLLRVEAITRWRILFAAALGIVALAAGWLGANPLAASKWTEIRDLTAPMVVAGSAVLVFLLPTKSSCRAALDLRTLLQRTRGTGLSDGPTLLALLSLFLSGTLCLAVSTAPLDPLSWLAPQFLIAASLLGFARAILITAAGAQLQTPVWLPVGLQLRVGIGLCLGQFAGAAAFWIFGRTLVPPTYIGMADLNILLWHAFSPFQLLGGAVGVLIAMSRSGLFAPFSIWGLGLAVAILLHTVQYLASYSVADGLAGAAFPALSALPLATTALVANFLIRSTSVLRLSRAAVAAIFAAGAVNVASAMAYLFFQLGELGIAFLSLPIAFGPIAAWPLVQRVVTDEPSVEREPPGWRPRPVAQWLWVGAPLVLLMSLEFKLSGGIRIDPVQLLIPSAIYLGWQFGLRGWRTALLMVLPAFWVTAPDPLSPPTLDIAATALLAAALFARPSLFSQICSTSSRSWWATLVLAATLSLQVSLVFNDQAAREATPAAQGSTKQSAPLVREGSNNIGSTGGPSQQAIEQQELPQTTQPRPTKLQWGPSSFLIVAMFLVGLSRLRDQAVAIVSAVVVAGLADFALDGTVMGRTPILPIPWVAALAGLFVYGLGHYLRAYLADVESARTSTRSLAANWIAPSLLLLAAVGAASLSIARYELQNDGGSMALLALASTLSWTAAIRVGKHRSGFGVGLAFLVGLGLFSLILAIGSANPANGHDAFSINSLSGSVSSMFLPAIFFVVGRLSQNSVLQARNIFRTKAEPTVSDPENATNSELRAPKPPPIHRRVIRSEASVTEPTGSNRRIVILADRPGMGYGENISHVLKLYMCLQGEQASAQQTVCYISGVATVSGGVWGRFRQDALSVLALATGYSLDTNVLAGYEFLVKNYQEGDDIYLFGFSGGAYTARVIAGLVHKIGLISPQQLQFAEAGLAAYKQFSERASVNSVGEDQAAQFANAFSTRRPTIKFVGAWDTVAPAVVLRPDRFFFPSLGALAFTTMNPSVKTFRQAISIDERRRMFRLKRWAEPQTFVRDRFAAASAELQDSLQVWFAGVHADVGGGYPEPVSSLSKFPLIWMVGEAVKFGLTINPVVFEELAWGVPREGSRFRHAPPDVRGPLHKSLSSSWWLLELLPKLAVFKEWPARRSFLGYYIPNGEPRLIPEGALIHESVVERMDVASYHPVNFPLNYEIVQSSESRVQVAHLAD